MFLFRMGNFIPPFAMSPTEIVAFAIAFILGVCNIMQLIFGFRDSSKSVKNDIIETYEKRLKQVDDAIEELTAKLDEMSVKFDKSEADRKRAEDTLNLRNPEFERYMTQSLQLLIEIHSAVSPQKVAPTS